MLAFITGVFIKIYHNEEIKCEEGVCPPPKEYKGGKTMEFVMEILAKFWWVPIVMVVIVLLLWPKK
jgi:hypothetical protein